MATEAVSTELEGAPREAGICLNSEDLEGIAEAILTLYRDPSLRSLLGENGREYVLRHFNREKLAERYEEHLLSCLSSN